MFVVSIAICVPQNMQTAVETTTTTNEHDEMMMITDAAAAAAAPPPPKNDEAAAAAITVNTRNTTMINIDKNSGVKFVDDDDYSTTTKSKRWCSIDKQLMIFSMYEYITSGSSVSSGTRRNRRFQATHYPDAAGGEKECQRQYGLLLYDIGDGGGGGALLYVKLANVDQIIQVIYVERISKVLVVAIGRKKKTDIKTDTQLIFLDWDKNNVTLTKSSSQWFGPKKVRAIGDIIISPDRNKLTAAVATQKPGGVCGWSLWVFEIGPTHLCDVRRWTIRDQSQKTKNGRKHDKTAAARRCNRSCSKTWTTTTGSSCHTQPMDNTSHGSSHTASS